MHEWNMIPWKFPVDGMNGSDFKGKTVGPVHFETVGMFSTRLPKRSLSGLSQDQHKHQSKKATYHTFDIYYFSQNHKQTFTDDHALPFNSCRNNRSSRNVDAKTISDPKADVHLYYD